MSGMESTIADVLDVLDDLGLTVISGDNGEYFCKCVRCGTGGSMRIGRRSSTDPTPHVYCSSCSSVPLEFLFAKRDQSVEGNAECDDTIELREIALHGLLGEYVRLRAPHTEIGIAPILVTALVTISTLIGRSPRWRFGDTDHHAVLFMLIVGNSGAGRKGSAINLGAYGLLQLIDPEFLAARVRSGLSSGEGLIAEIRDATPDREDAKGRTIPGDIGVSDKRLLVIESEFASVLESLAREGNRLSPVLRDLWDSRTVRTMVKQSPQTATNPHVGIIGAITPTELIRRLSQLSIDNGLANRFLPVISTRVRLLPEDSFPDEDQLEGVAIRLRRAIAGARQISTVNWTRPAAERWTSVYRVLAVPDTTSERLQTLLQRGAPMVRRIAMVYALMDGCSKVDQVHLDAALAVWDYSVESWRRIFGVADLRTPLAQRIGDAIEQSGADGLTRTGIRKAAGSNSIPRQIIESALEELRQTSTIFKKPRKTGGRNAERWYHARYIGEDRMPAHEQEGREEREESSGETGETGILVPIAAKSSTSLPSLPSFPSIPSPFVSPPVEHHSDVAAGTGTARKSPWEVAP